MKKLMMLLLLCVTVLIVGPATAAEWPTKPLTLIIPWAPGGMTDVSSRMLVERFKDKLGQPVMINNQGGAGGMTGMRAVLASAPNGYTFGSGAISSAFSAPFLLKTEPFDLDKVSYIGGYSFQARTVFTSPGKPYKTWAEFVEYAKKNPGKVRVSTTGVGSVPHFMLEMIQVMTGAQFTHVPFEGGESVVTAVLGGHVEASCDAYAKVSPHVDAGKIRVLLTNRKVPGHPQIPTITELGYKQSLPNSWFGLLAAAGIPEEAKNVLVPAAEKAIKNTKAKIEEMWGICEYKSPPEFKAMWEEEYKRVYEAAVKIGLRKP